MKQVYVILFSLIVGLISCKHSLINIPITPALKADFDYMPGTYWIYQDSISGRVDSFAVITYSFVTKVHGNSTVYTADEISIKIQEYNLTDPASIDTPTWFWGLDDSEIDIEYNSPISYHSSLDYYPLIYYPFKNEVLSKSDTVAFNPSFSIVGKLFSNVAVIHYANITSDSAVYFNDYFYMNYDIGLIEIKFNHPFDTLKRVWQLQRYNIVK